MKPLTLELVVPAKLLVLIGGGEFSFGDTEAIDRFLLAQLPEDRRRIAFLPTASGSAEYAAHFGKYLATLDPTVETVNVPVYRGRDSRRGKNLDALRSAGLIYLGGGVTNNLLGTLRGSPAETAMREAAESGTVIAAIGAAASSFGRHTHDMRGVAASLEGLGWVSGAVIEAPFDAQADEPLRRLMSLPDVAVGVGVPAGTALAIHAAGATEVVGPGPIAAYRKG